MWRSSKGDPGSDVLCSHHSKKERKKRKRTGEGEGWGTRNKAVVLEPVSMGTAQLCVRPSCSNYVCLSRSEVSQIYIKKPEVMGFVGTGTHLTSN